MLMSEVKTFNNDKVPTKNVSKKPLLKPPLKKNTAPLQLFSVSTPQQNKITTVRSVQY